MEILEAEETSTAVVTAATAEILVTAWDSSNVNYIIKNNSRNRNASNSRDNDNSWDLRNANGRINLATTESTTTVEATGQRHYGQQHHRGR